MNSRQNIFNKRGLESGGMLVEMLLTISLIVLVLPFVFNFQKSRITRAQNISISRELNMVQIALERYIEFNRDELLAPIGKNISRVKITDLEEYGLAMAPIEKHIDDFQLRILKSSDKNGSATLQGVIVLNNREITPLRTREILATGDESMGFSEGGRAVGAFGTWRTDAIDLGIGNTTGIIETTHTILDKDEYLWRIPSKSQADATMLSVLNLSGHDIINSKYIDSDSIKLEQFLKSTEIVADKIIFESKITLDKDITATDVVVSGTLSSDSKNMDIRGTLTILDTAKLSSLTTNDLWVNNLNLSGLSISSPGANQIPTLNVNQAIDMTAGHITTKSASIGFAGSITPKIIIKNKIEDASDSAYFWDASNSTARMSDVIIYELNRMAVVAGKGSVRSKNTASSAFGAVATNKNATVSDFIRVMSDIQNSVAIKYQQLNLE